MAATPLGAVYRIVEDPMARVPWDVSIYQGSSRPCRRASC